MHESVGTSGKRPWKPVIASVVGVAVASPVPILAGKPDLIPAWLLEKFLGAPGLAWAMLLIMLGLVILVMATISTMDATGA